MCINISSKSATILFGKKEPPVENEFGSESKQAVQPRAAMVHFLVSSLFAGVAVFRGRVLALTAGTLGPPDQHKLPKWDLIKRRTPNKPVREGDRSWHP